MQSVARRPHHPAEHHVEDIEGLRVGDEIESRLADCATGVTLPENLQLRSLPLNHDAADVRSRRFLGLRQLDASPLGPSDDLLLLPVIQFSPSFEIVNRAPNRDVAASRKDRVLASDQGSGRRGFALGFSFPSMKPVRSRESRYRKPWTSSVSIATSRRRRTRFMESSRFRS